jgi:hypothetical protein
MGKTHSLESNGVAGDLPDLADLRLPDHMIPAVKVDLPSHREIKARKAKQYVPAMPLPWFEAVCRLPSPCCPVAIVTWWLCKSHGRTALKHGGWVPFTNTIAKRFGFARRSENRALRSLARLKLIANRQRIVSF